MPSVNPKAYSTPGVVSVVKEIQRNHTQSFPFLRISAYFYAIMTFGYLSESQPFVQRFLIICNYRTQILFPRNCIEQ